VSSRDKIKSQNLSENGPVLPVGFTNSLDRGILAKRWRLKEEKELSAIFEDSGAKMDKYVSSVIATMFTKLGPHDLTTMDAAKKMLIIGQMSMPDVFFAYLYLRIQAMGNELTFNLLCPKCREIFPFTVDLNTVVIRSIEKLEDAEWIYKLRDPFPIRGKVVKELKLGPPNWSTLRAISDEGFNPGSIKAGMIIGSIASVGFETGHSAIPLAKHELDEMAKKDFESLASEIDRNSLGPDMSVDACCSKCKNEFKTSIQWTAESFFGVSSLSES
jgi:hypothetical protein